MSRIGKHPVPVPAGVDVAVNGQTLTAKGKLGQLSMTLIDDIEASLDDGKVVVKPRHADSKRGKTMWATSRTLVANMVKGVSEGFTVTSKSTASVTARPCRATIWFSSSATRTT